MSTAVAEMTGAPIQMPSTGGDDRRLRVDLAPLFATALATGNSHTAFLVGVAAAVGTGISGSCWPPVGPSAEPR